MHSAFGCVRIDQIQRFAAGEREQVVEGFAEVALEHLLLDPGAVRRAQHVAHREQRMLAAAALERVGLKGREQHYPTQLSGGQQQRVAIARALVTTPSLLLADEPTGNLDTESSREIMTILDRLNRDAGITVILVTHEPDIAAYAAREIVIKDGQVLTDRRTRPEHPSSLVER